MSYLRKIFSKKKPSIPFKGYDQNRSTSPLIEQLTDEELISLNELLDWNCFVADSKGRRFGNLAWSDKRDTPSSIPDRRHLILQQRVDLSQQTVLEIGCFEGIHTISLCKLAKEVIAIDSRIENVVKTMIRSNFFDCYPKVSVCNVEEKGHLFDALKADFCHHFGVLYHLKNPISHILALGKNIKNGIFLDTHIADTDIQPILSDTQDNITYQYTEYKEENGVFAGMYDHAKWLTLDSLKNIFESAGFNHFELIEERLERNGKRILALIQRK